MPRGWSALFWCLCFRVSVLDTVPQGEVGILVGIRETAEYTYRAKFRVLCFEAKQTSIRSAQRFCPTCDLTQAFSFKSTLSV